MAYRPTQKSPVSSNSTRSAIQSLCFRRSRRIDLNLPIVLVVPPENSRATANVARSITFHSWVFVEFSRRCARAARTLFPCARCSPNSRSTSSSDSPTRRSLLQGSLTTRRGARPRCCAGSRRAPGPARPQARSAGRVQCPRPQSAAAPG